MNGADRLLPRTRDRVALSRGATRAARTVRRIALCAALFATAVVTTATQAQLVRPTASAVGPELVFTIDVRWLGASSYRLERDVTVKVENAVKRLPGVRRVHSTAIGSRSQTSVAFDARTDASSTASAIRAQLDQIRTRLPRDASQPQIAWHREPTGER